ncbi:MAG: sigma-E processing peptidase SpoIIGA [Clostridia bacterium]|nr:sigma-E processing peptidase SpoIIGA [Clostridia bacterium]
MEIVIEYVLLDNFLIDALLMTLTIKTLRLPFSKAGIMCASAFGAGFAVISPLINVGGILAILMKLSVAFVMAFMACFSLKRVFSRFLVFALYTFAFGGALVAIFTFLGVQVYDAMYIGYVSSLPLGTLLVCAFMFFVAILRLIRLLKNKRTWGNSVNFEIEILGKRKKVKGFIDTGNTLKNREGKPVVVLPERELSFWFSAHDRMMIMFDKGQSLGLKNLDFIVVGSFGGSYKMRVFDAKITIDGKESEACVGVANGKVRCGDCQAVIGSELLEAM